MYKKSLIILCIIFLFVYWPNSKEYSLYQGYEIKTKHRSKILVKQENSLVLNCVHQYQREGCISTAHAAWGSWSIEIRNSNEINEFNLPNPNVSIFAIGTFDKKITSSNVKGTIKIIERSENGVEVKILLTGQYDILENDSEPDHGDNVFLVDETIFFKKRTRNIEDRWISRVYPDPIYKE